MKVFASVAFYMIGWVQAGSSFHSRDHKPTENTTAATIFALEYGYPLLVAWDVIATALINNTGLNKLRINDEIAVAGESFGIYPNADTLYAEATLDLSADIFTLTVPEVDDDRYWSFSFFDGFGENYAVIGSISGSSFGNYTLRWNPQLNGQTIVEDKGNLSIQSPVAYGLLIVRILVRNNGTDLAQAAKVINGCKLTKARPRPRAAFDNTPLLSLATFEGLSQNATGVLELTARTLNGLPPINVTNPRAVDKELNVAGIHQGSYSKPPGVNLTTATNVALEAIANYEKTSAFFSLGNGWKRFTTVGLFGSDYVARAYVVAQGQESERITESLYTYPEGNTSLAEGEAYLATFSSKPPIGPTGFWSVTMYQSGYLVENPINIYAVGDRSNITYPDGSLVYGGGSSSSNKTFQILVQSAAAPPPANWTHNWLPSPRNYSDFSIIFRLYSPTPSLVSGSWPYPIVTKIKAITA